DAIAQANTYLKAQFAAANIAYTPNVAATADTVTVNVSSTYNTMMAAFVGKPTVALGVSSTAAVGYKPSSTTIQVTDARGYWYKVMTIWVVPVGQSTETLIAKIEYQPTQHSLNNGLGGGTMTLTPKVTNNIYSFGQYSKLYLKMEVKQDGCPIGQ